MNKYISRGAVLSRVDEVIVAHHLRPDYVWFTPNEVKMLALEAPAADVVEVVHARPVKFYCDARTGRMMTTCSACDLKIGPYDSFCKHCGAKMDGGQDDV